MLNRMRPLIAIVVLGAMLIGINVSVSAQRRAYSVSDQQVAQLLQTIESHGAMFRRSLSAALNRTPLDGTRQEDNINGFVRDFEAAIMNLRDRYRDRRDVSDDVTAVLNRAASIDSFMRRRQLSPDTERDWRQLRSDLDVLANYYAVTWNWNGQASTPGRLDTPGRYDTPGRNGSYPGRNNAANRLTGTYRLDRSQSDDSERVIRQATRELPTQDQERLSQMLQRRLDAPDMLAIQRDGRNVTVGSSLAQPVTFEADGSDHTEQTPRGRTVRVTTTLNGDQLIVSSVGDQGNDFRITFDPIEGGRRLRVTRSIDVERLSQPVVVTSVYNKTAEGAQLDLYNDRGPVGGRPPVGGGRPRDGAFYTRDGDQINATLNEDLSTKRVRDGDRFTMTVQSPPNLAGAIIEGHVATVDRSGRVSGRSAMALNFDRIRLRNGTSSDFDGTIETVRTSNGEDVRVDNEGSVAEDDSQTKRTVTRGGIGAGIGAVLGAIAGGGKGAAVGAVIGAGAGAGSVFVQGRDDLDLLRGTEFVIRAAAPRSAR